MWWIILLIALALLLFVGEEASGNWLDFVGACFKYGLPIGSVIAAMVCFFDKESRNILKGVGWIIAAIVSAWFFGWFR